MGRSRGGLTSKIAVDDTNGQPARLDAEIKRAITKGIRRDGTTLKPPMSYPSYDKMTDDDLSAIVAYLRSLPPKE